MSLKITKTLPKNQNIISFYHQNNVHNDDYKYKRLNDSLLICTYNVHGWININDNINYHDNFNNIFNILSKINPDILVLQEVCLRDTLNKNYLVNKFNTLGYIDYFIVQNGGCFLDHSKSDYVMVFSKAKITLKIDLDITCSKYFIRHCAIVKTYGYLFACVHLEIGNRYHYLPNNSPLRQKIIRTNSTNRTKQLEKILTNHTVDIIVGDFNFTINDSEFNYLIDYGFNYIDNYKNNNTTPYNRTDMLFTKNNIFTVKSSIVCCNFSDHLPVIYELMENELVHTT